ncbi:MAG: hypothetical protein UU22_C0028G0002 [Parcubacteria group bacterium GW2011_GWA2_40_8]|nr:MAG: hypothetical protein UU22_C0028G0002 [Parcubacteria group bacterium GW2011_GWA2_40_8]
MDGIFWAPQIKKHLQEEEFFPAKEELLRILEEYKLREDEINGSHQISKTPLNLMPHTESNYPLFHFSFYQKKNISLKWTILKGGPRPSPKVIIWRRKKILITRILN